MRLLLALLLLGHAALAADRTVAQAGPGHPFTASVETLKVSGAGGAPVAEIVATAFWRSLSVEAPVRPVTFAVNGGPGAASAWLNLGAIGPWRVPLQLPVSPSQDPTPVDNEQSWLPFTDLMFLDPPGTGYSRLTPDSEEARRSAFTVDGDIGLLAATIERWLDAHGRRASPVFIVGESYGGFRAPRLARTLLDRHGIGVRGLVLVSPVLDFNGRDAPYDPIRWAARLPSLAALAIERRTGAAADRGQLRDAEGYASGDYVAELLRGPGDPAALDRLSANLSRLTGLDPGLIRRRGGRLDLDAVLRDATPGQVGSPYDATIVTQDPFPTAVRDNSPDPVLDGLKAPVTAGMLALYQRLGWQPEGAPRRYGLLDEAVAREWNFGRGNVRPESMTALRQFLALDPAVRVLVAHGLTDLVTPYFATALLLNQVNRPSPGERLQLATYQGGHMFYLRDSSRAAMMNDARSMIAGAVPHP